jgi:hypothetical protein
VAVLPTPGSDAGVWGSELNTWLQVGHNADGTNVGTIVGPAGPASAVAAFTLNASTSIGATTIVLATTPANIAVKVGDYIAIGAGTANCEVRRVATLSTATITFTVPTKVAHTAGNNVWVTPGFWVPLEWWGAISNSLVDSYRSLINAFLDQTVQVGYGLIGHGTSYYGSSRPLFVNDYASLQQAALGAYVPFAIDCTIGTDTLNPGNIPNQYFMTLAGQVVTATADASADTVTLGGSIGGAGQDVSFYPRPGSTMPGGIEEGRKYFALGAGLTTQITLSQGSATPVDITSAGSGEIVCISTGLARMQWKDCRLSGAIKGLNGLKANVQQPSICESLRIEYFPVIGATIAADQGTFPNLMIYGCWMGLELAGCEMGYFGQGNIESCDISCSVAEFGRSFGGSSNFNCSFNDFHWESAGFGNSQVQVLYHDSGNLTGGSFQLRLFNVLTASIPYNVSPAALQAILEAHPSIGVGNVAVSLQPGFASFPGPNLDNGRFILDFTVGTRNWEYWVGSTDPNTGGESAIVNSTVTPGGYLAVSMGTPYARNISFNWGRDMQFTNCEYGNANCPFLTVEGTAATSQAPINGFLISNLYTGANITLIADPVGGDVLSDDTTGCGHNLTYYARPYRHGGSVGQHWWLVGERGRKVKLNTLGKSQIEVIAESLQSDDMQSWAGLDATVGARVNKNGYFIVHRNTVPADAELAANELAFWFDPTNGASALKIKAKQADGTVKTATVALS